MSNFASYQITAEEAEQVRAQNGPEQTQQPVFENPPKATREDAKVQTYVHDGARQMTSADFHGRDGVLGTSNDLKVSDSSLVTVDGIQMRADHAAAMGFVHRNGDGTYQNLKKSDGEESDQVTNQGASTAQGDQADQEASAESHSDTPSFDQEAAQAIDQVGEQMGEARLQDLTTSYIASDGQVGNLADYAADAGVSPDELAGTMQQVDQAFYKQASDYVRSRHPGVDPDAVFGWARENLDKGLVMEAMNRHVFGNDLSHYDKMVSKYRESFSTSQAPGMDDLVSVGGIQMPRRTAIQMGLA